MMDLSELNKKKQPRVIDEVNYGVYVWQMPDGRWVADDEGNWLNIASMRRDPKRIAELVQAVRSFGINEGGPVFLAGHRQIDDEEYANQKARMAFGLIPDESDIPALMEEAKQRNDRA